MTTIAGRECGACVECCRFMPIVTEALEKPTNLLCPHCTVGRGCGVYERRPHVCRNWDCGWKTLPAIPDDWRPDASGLVFRMGRVAVGQVTIAILDAGPCFASERFAGLVVDWVGQGLEVYFQAAGPAGHFLSSAPVNDEVEVALASGEPGALQRAFATIFRTIGEDATWEPDGLVLRSALGS